MKKVFNIHSFSFLFVIIITTIFSIIDVNATITWDSDINTITITRTVTGVTIPVTNTFDYTITADTNNPTGATGAPTTASIVMTDQAIASSPANTATLSTTVDFSNMSFNQPGYYNYIISETGSTNSTRYPLDSHTYTVEIVVHNANASAPDGIDFTAKIITWNDATPPTKVNTATFTSASPQSSYGHIELSKNITGSGADANMFFRIGVKIYTDGTFTISGLDPTGTCLTQTSQPSTVVGKDESPSYRYMCIKSGETITIGVKNSLNQIPEGTRIDFTEPSYATDGYTTSYVLNGGTPVNNRSKTNYTMLSGTTTFDYTNAKTIDPPTGVLVTTVPYIILIIVVSAGIFIFMKFKNKNSSTEEEIV